MSDVAAFEYQRVRLLGLAYRMLGEMSAAEDVVQEAWLRWSLTDSKTVHDVRAWLSAVTVRLSLDALRRVQARRESYVGPWLPEPLAPDAVNAFTAEDPGAHVELASDLSLALLYLLERLSPEERAAFILHDAFDCEYAEIAATLGKSEVACRKLVSRARARVRADYVRQPTNPEDHKRLLLAFAAAAASNDSKQLKALLSEDVVVVADGGGRVQASLSPVVGADNVARFVAEFARTSSPQNPIDVQLGEVNGQPSLVLRAGGALFGTVSITSDGERITAIFAIRNPEKLARIDAALATSPL